MAQTGWKRVTSRLFSSTGEGLSGKAVGGSFLAASIMALLLVPQVLAAEEPVDGEPLDGEQQAPDKPKEPPKPYVVPDAEQTRFNVLANQADPRELLELSANNEAVLALFRPEYTPKAHGALVILHEEDGHPDRPMVVNPVRAHMPDFGWAMLSVAVPRHGPPTLSD